MQLVKKKKIKEYFLLKKNGYVKGSFSKMGTELILKLTVPWTTGASISQRALESKENMIRRGLNLSKSLLESEITRSNSKIKKSIIDLKTSQEALLEKQLVLKEIEAALNE